MLKYVLQFALISLLSQQLLAGPPADQPRTWTNVEGKKVSAQLMHFVDSEHVLLKTTDGKQHSVKLSTLSTTDREYIARLNAGKVRLVTTAQATTSQSEVDLSKRPEVKAAFQELAKKTGQATITRTRLETRTQTTCQMVMECRRVCENGRWVWKWISVPQTTQQVITVEVPYTEQTASRLIDGTEWTKTDPATGVAEGVTIDLSQLPSSAGARARKILLACQTLVDVEGVPTEPDTFAVMASVNWMPVAGTPNVERAYQIIVSVNPATFQSINMDVLVREQNRATLTRATDKPRLDQLAQTLATDIRAKLLVP